MEVTPFMETEFKFTTKPEFVKRNGVTILGLYPDEGLVRKMIKSHHVLRRPPGLTIDASAYASHVEGKTDWTIVFDISDGRRFWITVPEFDRHRKWINRGQGEQHCIEFKYLHRGGDLGLPFNDNLPNQSAKRKGSQLQFNFEGQS
jgi:hypothetical protein